MRGITRYFWQVYYWLRPVGRQSTKTAYVKAACRVHGIKMIEHPVVRPEAADYRGLGWTGVTKSKICAETTCNHVFVPNSSGRCPKCGSEAIWLSNTAIGNKPEDAAMADIPQCIKSRLLPPKWLDAHNEAHRIAAREYGYDVLPDGKGGFIYKKRAKGVLKWEE